MILKIIAGLIGAGLLITYVLPVTWRLKDVPLWCVAALGIGMMLIDLWESLKSKDD